MMNNNIFIIICSEFPPGPGGIGNHAYNLAKWLSIRGKDVEVWTPGRTQLEKSEFSFDSGQPFTINRYVKGKWRLFYYISLIKKLKNAIVKKKAGNIITSGMVPLILGGILKQFINTEHQLTSVVHGLDINPSNSLLRSLIRWALTKYNIIIPVSRFTASHLPENVKLKSHIINNGIDDIMLNQLRMIDGNQERTKLHGYPSLITVGTVSERKGQLNVIKALPEILMRFPEVQYHIVGRPDEISQVLKLASELGVRNQVTVHGAVSNEELIKLLCGSDLFIMLSTMTKNGDFEGFGIAILEANLMGIPAIGANGTGIEDAILEGETGFLVDNENPQQITKSIELVLSNRTYYSGNAVRFAIDHSWSKTINNYLGLLDR